MYKRIIRNKTLRLKKRDKSSSLQIDKIRDSIIFYIKLDFWFLAAIATLFTILKLNGPEIAKQITHLKNIIYIIFALIIFGLLIERLMILYWNELNRKSGLNFLKILLIVQTIGHFILFSDVLAHGLGYSEGFTTGNEEIKKLNLIQGSINNFVNKNKYIPKSIEEVLKEFPDLFQKSPNVSKDKFEYNYIDKNNYEILLYGNKFDSLDVTRKKVTIIFE